MGSRLEQPFIAMNPLDAQIHKTAEGMTVNLGVNGVSSPAVVVIDESVPQGFALVPRNCGIPVIKPERVEIQIADAIVD